MERTIFLELQKWNAAQERKPLLVRGARQVGKSWAIEQFGKRHFRETVTLNFDLHPKYSSCFHSLDPKSVIPSIELLTGSRISSNTLLFLDEIQECPNAIRSLRYFREQRPDIPVIGAGSLLEFALNAESFRMPVGRVSFLTIYPLSFQEFLTGAGKKQLVEYLNTLSGLNRKNLHEGPELIPKPVHEELLASLRTYMLLGGMPDVLNTFFSDPTHPTDAFRIQDELLQTFRRDFGKYASRANHPYMEKVFMTAPALTGKRIKYVQIDPDARSRELKKAINLLSSAGLVRKIHRTDASGLPLEATASQDKFKLLFLDVGLSGNLCGLSDQFVLEKELVAINSGSVAEQYAGQELLLLQEPWKDGILHYWDRESKSSSAEVDYVIQAGSSIIPIEIKSGTSGRLRSLFRFMEEKKPPLGLRLYTGPLHFDGTILSLPLYLTGELHRILKEFL